jgi:hypothetical protein
MFCNARALCTEQPELNGYLMDYLRTQTMPASQTRESFVPHVVQLAAVMRYTGNRQARAVSTLDANTEEPTPAAAGGSITLESISEEKKKLRQELEDIIRIQITRKLVNSDRSEIMMIRTIRSCYESLSCRL